MFLLGKLNIAMFNFISFPLEHTLKDRPIGENKHSPFILAYHLILLIWRNISYELWVWRFSWKIINLLVPLLYLPNPGTWCYASSELLWVESFGWNNWFTVNFPLASGHSLLSNTWSTSYCSFPILCLFKKAGTPRSRPDAVLRVHFPRMGIMIVVTAREQTSKVLRAHVNRNRDNSCSSWIHINRVTQAKMEADCLWVLDLP